MRDIERAHQVNLDDGLAGVAAQEMEDRAAHGFQLRHPAPALLPDFLDHFFRWCGARSRAVGGTAGIVDHDLGALSSAEQRDLAADAAPSTGDDDGLAFK